MADPGTSPDYGSQVNGNVPALQWALASERSQQWANEQRALARKRYKRQLWLLGGSVALCLASAATAVLTLTHKL